MSYSSPNISSAPSAYSRIWLLFSAETATPVPYFMSTIRRVPSATIIASPVPKPSFTQREKSSRCSTMTRGSGHVRRISSSSSSTKAT